jgi:hypothetical protein
LLDRSRQRLNSSRQTHVLLYRAVRLYSVTRRRYTLRRRVRGGSVPSNLVLRTRVRLKELFTKVVIENFLFPSAGLRNAGKGALMQGISAEWVSARVSKLRVKRTVRPIAFFACLALLATPLATMGPTGALAQTTKASEAPPVTRAKKTSKSRSNALPGSPLAPASPPPESFAPAPPTFYSVDQPGDHLYSVRWELAAAAVCNDFSCTGMGRSQRISRPSSA